MWERIEDRLALLELLETSELSKRTGQTEAWTLLAELPWTRKTGRRDEIALVPNFRDRLTELITRVWPEWNVIRDALSARGLKPTPAGWRRLQDISRAESVIDLPVRLNQRTAASIVAPHSKSELSAIRRAALGDTTVTRDGLVRLRPLPGLSFKRDDKILDMTETAAILGEVAITERAMLDGTTLNGRPRATLLVENLGSYQDLSAPHGWLVAHIPGWNTATVHQFLEQLPNVPIFHFGDLDPAGVRIVHHLKQIYPDLRWVVPDFWREYIQTRALPGEWPPDLSLETTPKLVQELAERGLWLEQEPISIDPRLKAALEAFGS